MVLAAVALIMAILACNGTPEAAKPVSEGQTTSSAANANFAVRRELVSVSAGPQYPLPELTDNSFHGFSVGDLVTTDTAGEALVQSQSGGKQCNIYVFQDTELMQRPCSKSVRGNAFVCQTKGGASYRDCGGHLELIDTPVAAFKLIGTWVTVVYLPDRRESIIMVLDGTVEAQPVVDFDARTLGAAVTVPSGYFWFTDPGTTGSVVRGLAPRTPHPLDSLPPIIEELGLAPWIQRTRPHAEQDVVAFPAWLTCAPGVLYCENFEDRLAAWWRFDPGWGIVQEDGGWVIRGEGHVWAALTERQWDDARVRFRLKPLQGNIHLAYRYRDEGRGPIRYFVAFTPTELQLHKQVENRLELLTSARLALPPGRWYRIEIGGRGGRIQVLVDDRLALDFADPDSLRQGSIAFETQEGARAAVDDIEVLPMPVTGTIASAPSATPAPACQVLSPLNIRQGPGTNYPTSGQGLGQGARLSPLGRSPDGGWVFVQVIGTGQQGWVSANRDWLACNVPVNELRVLPAPPTSTPVPTSTRTPTRPPPATSRPTSTPIPSPTAQVSCGPQQTVIEPGGCTTLSWNVRHVRAVYLDGGGVTGQESRQVCPAESHTYELRVVTGAGDQYCRMNVLVQDKTPPTISDIRTSPDHPICGVDQLRVTARVTDPSGIASVRISQSSACQYISADGTSMKSEGNDVFSYVVPTGSCFRIQATDSRGNLAESEAVLPACTSVVYDLVAQAPSAYWRGWLKSPGGGWVPGANLSWSGSGGDDRGFARWMDNAVLEDGSRKNRVLEMHPPWVDDSFIEGDFPKALSLQGGDYFVARVGFLEGAGAGDVEFTASVCWELDGDYCVQLARVTDTYDGRLRDISVNLDKYVGSNRSFKLHVFAHGTSAQDWAIWQMARIERRR
jgi:uncharacterized protein YraI